MPATRRLLVSLGLAAAIWMAWQWWVDPRRVIARRLDQIADVLSTPAGAGELERFARAARLTQYFAPDVHISAGRPGPSVTSRDALVAAVAAWKGNEPAGGRDVQVVDVEVTLESASAARASMTVRLVGVDPRTGVRSVDAREVAARLADVDGEWVITGARLVETLERP